MRRNKDFLIIPAIFLYELIFSDFQRRQKIISKNEQSQSVKSQSVHPFVDRTEGGLRVFSSTF